eukprot:TRINITY_DN67677_c7_g7_i1.p1 TRINITY_DN67677_c7_g7~~TRINITY_DN67677_c7_g7_i1.p1  ORF type:complete len:364 (+),score=30.04 TRINITY_DN67677_c7_g7_i1:70-1161(+)
MSINEIDRRVEELFPLSEMRTPLMFILDEGDPYPSIKKLAEQKGCVLWDIKFFFSDTTSGPTPEETMETFNKAVDNGDWLYLSQAEYADQTAMREVGRALLLAQPDAGNHPNRGRFRLWIAVTSEFSIHRTQPLEYPYFPPILLHNAYLAIHGRIEQRSPTQVGEEVCPVNFDHLNMTTSRPVTPARPESSTKTHQTVIMKTALADPSPNDMVEEAPQDPSWCRTGPWFHRVKDFWNSQESVQEWLPVFQAIEVGDAKQVQKMLLDGLPVNTLINEDGQTPLHFAIRKNNVKIVKILFEGGADPTTSPVEDVPPPLFSGIQSLKILELFIDNDVDVCGKTHKGYHLATHPLTTRVVVDYLNAC